MSKMLIVLVVVLFTPFATFAGDCGSSVQFHWTVCGCGAGIETLETLCFGPDGDSYIYAGQVGCDWDEAGNPCYVSYASSCNVAVLQKKRRSSESQARRKWVFCEINQLAK